MILYDLSFSVPPTSHLELYPFETFREPLVVLAIADGRELAQDTGEHMNGSKAVAQPHQKHPTPDGLGQLLGELDLVRERNPRALVHQLLIFDFDGLDKLTNGPDDVLWIPRPQASKATTVKTVLCDITSLLFGELDEFAKTIQSRQAIESPKASSWGPHRGPELRPRPSDRLFHRVTLPSHLPSDQNGASETPQGSNNSSPAPSDQETPITFDEITRSMRLNRVASVSKANSVSSSKEHSRDRSSVSGLSATDRTKSRIRGRAGVIVGSLFLQAGRWPDAVKELVEAASNARATSDYVWHAKALESILLCLLMLGWAGMEFQVYFLSPSRWRCACVANYEQIPPICYPVSDKSHKALYSSGSESAPGQSTGNRINSLQNLTNLLPDLSNNIINLYNRAAIITDEPLPQLVFSETVIRLARLLVAVRIRGGSLDDNALRHIVMNESLLPLHQSEHPRGNVVLRKSEIANFLFRALPLSPSSDLPATDAVPIIVGVVSVLSVLDLPRKKAFVLRELLAIMVPTLVQARKIGAAEVGVHPAAGLASLADTTFDINALDIGPGNMEESIRALLATIGEIYGVQPSAFCEWKKRRSSTSDEMQSQSEYDTVPAIVERSFRHVIRDGYGDMNLKIDLLRACINCCEALPDFEGVLRFTVELLQTVRGDLMLSEAQQTPPYLPPDEQIRLSNNIKRTVSTASKLGASDVEAEYWDDFLVRNVQLLSLPGPRKPVRRSRTQLDAYATKGENSKKDPFLYNPLSKTSSKASELLMVAGEYASFRVTLQNPYEFDLEIERLRLDSDGVSFEAEAEFILIPRLSLQDIEVFGIAHEEGTLNITSCTVKVRFCRERKFPIFTSLWKPEPEKKFKRTGLAAKKAEIERPLSWNTASPRNSKEFYRRGPETASCEVKIIGQQPTLLIESMSVSQSAMMVLEGETRSFDITLRNVSQYPLNFILFTFQDSTTKQLQSALNNKDLLPVEIYELELKLATKPALRWRQDGRPTEDLSIPSGQSATFTVDIFGKAGLQDATVQIDYSYVGYSHGELPEVFYTRQLFVPLTVTVNASVEVARCDMSPLTGDFAWSNSRESDLASQPAQSAAPLSLSTNPVAGADNDPFSPILSQLGRDPCGSDHCVLLLDLRNAWPNPLTVSLYASEQPVEPATDKPSEERKPGQYAVHGDLQPGQVSRFALVLPRVYLDNPHASIPLINTGNKRQFVVSAHKLSFEAEAASRETYWYREELLKRVFGSWREVSSGREGTIDMRNIRLNSRMVEAMRLEDVEMAFSLAPSFLDTHADAPDKMTVVQVGRSKYIVQTDDMLNLTVTVRNRSSRAIHPLLRLQPSLRHQPKNVALDLSRRLVWTGMLQQVLPVLHSGQSAQATVGATVLCRGEYEFGATVEEVRLLKPSDSGPYGSADGKGGDTQSSQFHDEEFIKDTFGADMPKRRRIWHAKETCVMYADD